MLKRINIRWLIAFVFILAPIQLSYAGYDDFTVNVPNAQGGYTAIVIKKSGEGYVGPQGEYYTQFPTVAQLQAMYSTGTPAPVVVAPITYVQPQVQTQVTYQVVNQEPYEDRDDYYVERPVIQPTVIEENQSYQREDDKDWTFFEFKKKKKSQSQSNNQNPPNHSGNNNWQSQKQLQGTNNPPSNNQQQTNQKQNVNLKPNQGQQAQTTNGSNQANQNNNQQSSPNGKWNPQNKTGT